jgi:hypothetical protein
MFVAVTNADAVKDGTVNGFSRGALHLIAITGQTRRCSHFFEIARTIEIGNQPGLLRLAHA